MTGTTVCRTHGGTSPSHETAAARRIAEAEAEAVVARVLDVDGPLPDHVDVRQELLRAAWAHRRLVQHLAGVIGADVTTEAVEGEAGEGAAPVTVRRVHALLDRWQGAMRDYTRLLDALRRADLLDSGQGEQVVETVFSPRFAAGLDAIAEALGPWPDASRAVADALLALRDREGLS